MVLGDSDASCAEKAEGTQGATSAAPSNLSEKKESPSIHAGSDAFGNEEFAEVKYKVLSWWQCGFLMVAETVSLGILSLPAAVAGLGLVPAIIILLGLGVITSYTGYVIGQFRWRYPHVQSMADAGEILLGSFGREFFGAAQLILLIFVMASHILTFTVAMNTITNHGTCTVVFGVIGLIVSFLGCLPRTLKGITNLSILSFASILTAVIITMVAVGIEKPGKGQIHITLDTSLYSAFLSVLNIIFAYSAHVAFFGFMSELKDPKDYPKALCLLQGLDTVLYIVVGCVIYYYTGSAVASPALGSAGPLVRKIAYGIALPTIVISGVVNGHVNCKYVYVRIFRGTDRMHKNDLVAKGSWYAIAATLWVLAWIIAEAIPVFSNLLSLIASLFSSWFTFGLCGIFWLYLNRGNYFSSPAKMALTAVNSFIVGTGLLIMGLGLYVSGTALSESPPSASFSCANNA